MTGPSARRKGDACAFTGTQEVRYGASGSLVYQTVSNGITCPNGALAIPS